MNRSIARINLFVLLAVSPLLLPAAARRPTPAVSEREDRAARYRTARTLHLKGVDGDDESAERALAMLTALAEEDPSDPLIVVYFGSAKVLAGKRTFFPWNKVKLVEEGLAYLDRAVELAPNDLEVRFVRGITSYPLPFFFGREKQAAADFAFVAERLRGGTVSGKIPPRLAGGAFYYHGLCLEDEGREAEARIFLEKAAAAAPGSSFARLAAEKLDHLTGGKK